MPYLIDSDVVIDHLADVAAATTLLEQLAAEGIIVVTRNVEDYTDIRGLKVYKAN